MRKLNLVAMIAFTLVMVSACAQENPREAFRQSLESKIDQLIRKLDYLGSGEQERVEVEASSSGKSSTTTMMVPKSAGIRGIVIDIHRLFTGVEFAFLNQDVDGFDEWGKNLKQEIVTYKERLDKKTDQIAARLQESPAKGDPNFVTSLVNLAGQVEIDRDGELYVLVGSGNTQGHYYPKETFQIDIDEWLVDTKAQAEKFQVYDASNNPLSLDERTLIYISDLAEEGNPRAQFDLARKYLNGDGVDHDLVLAYKWASLAMKNGSSQASHLSTWIREPMTQEQIDQANEMAADWIMKHKAAEQEDAS